MSQLLELKKYAKKCLQTTIQPLKKKALEHQHKYDTVNWKDTKPLGPEAYFQSCLPQIAEANLLPALRN
jgi:hypothetical protein